MLPSLAVSESNGDITRYGMSERWLSVRDGIVENQYRVLCYQGPKARLQLDAVSDDMFYGHTACDRRHGNNVVGCNSTILHLFGQAAANMCKVAKSSTTCGNRPGEQTQISCSAVGLIR